MVAWFKQPYSKPSFRKLFLETCTTKTSKVPTIESPISYKRASKVKAFLFPPTITHSNWSTCLMSQLCPNTSDLHTPLNPALTQQTSPLIRDPPFDKINFICPMSASLNLKSTYMLLPSHTSWPSIPCSTHPSLVLQTSGIPNHMVYATNSGYTKPHARILVLGALHVPNHVRTLNQSTVISLHKRTPWYLIWLNHATL